MFKHHNISKIMKKLIVLLAAIFLSVAYVSRADEGMWIPTMIDDEIYDEMRALGLNLTAEEIYSVNNSSLKDAIVIFGRGCTGEIISDQGLLITNHHCGYGQIQSHSTVEHDYLKDGFWASNLEEELPNPGLTAKFLVRIQDVSDKILNEINAEMTEEDRNKKIEEVIASLTTEATEGTHYDALVRSFFEGNEHYLFVYETFTDVRFVGAPPSSIGKFGADTDNWMWPRHTGDFSIFRVYTAPDGTPADYSEGNVPLKPNHFLPISPNGFKKGDFAMILGYPGSTQRYLTSYGVDIAINKFNPTIVDIRDKKLKIMRKKMDADDATRIKYATKYARTSNYWKYFIGQTKGLKRLKVYDKKKLQEEEFRSWINENSTRQEIYGETLNDIRDAYETIGGYTVSKVYFSEAIIRGPEILTAARMFNPLYDELTADKQDKDKIDEMIQKSKEQIGDFYKDYDAEIDRNLFAAMMQMYHENVPLDQQPAYLLETEEKYKDDFSAFADDVFEKSFLSSKEGVMNFLQKPKAKTLEKDPAWFAYTEFLNYYTKLKTNTTDAESLLNKGNRKYVAGLREMYPDNDFYPDANFTMRLTYGTVQDYKGADAVYYNYFTTLKGVMEKEDPDNWEFVVSDKLKELYKDKDFGPYGEDGVMKVCFLTDHDITGGNSGSPVINKNGELIGLAFDGNWEAMSGDIAFEPEVQRTINVDIRYVLFIIDKYAGAQNIIDEITLVPKTRQFSISKAEFMEKISE